jgi:hypothetical protein
MGTKICFKCKTEKDLSEFNKSKSRKDGHRTYCRDCEHESGAIYRDIHSEEIKERHREEYRLNPEPKKQYEKDHKTEADARKKKYVLNNPEKRKESANGWYHRNKAKVKESTGLRKDQINRKRREYNATHPQARIAHNLRTRIGHYIHSKSNGGRLIALLGCTIDFFKEHLESQFKEGMSWDNYGSKVGNWSIDHYIVLDSFDITDEEEQKRAFHYSNCHPMWVPQNASKSNRYNGDYIPN